MFVTRPCFYCDEKPNNSINAYIRKDGTLSSYAKRLNYENTDQRSKDAKLTYNGIDRLNNMIGYKPGNCVSSCKKCNYLKSDSHFLEFVAHIDRVANCRGVSASKKYWQNKLHKYRYALIRVKPSLFEKIFESNDTAPKVPRSRGN